MARVFGDLEIRYLREVMDSGRMGWWKGGMVTRFEEAFAKRVGAQFGVACSSSITGLIHALNVSDAGVGTEVICDPISYFGALSAIRLNAVPRFADVRYETFLMDPASVRQNITEHTRALIVTNLWGLCAELDELRNICSEHGIFMMENCAHAIGSYRNGKHAGKYGDLSVFSFRHDQQLSTGDGAMIVTDKEDLYQKLHQDWVTGEEPVKGMTLDFRMNEVTAAIGYAQLQRVNFYLEEYEENLNKLNEVMERCKWLRKREVSEGAGQSGYIWACVWEGDKYGLDYEHFKQICKELEVPVKFGPTGKPAYTYDFFRTPTAYHNEHCPTRCLYYKSDYRYREGLCPVAEDLIPRIITSEVMEISEREMQRRAALLRKAIRQMEKSG